MKVSTQKSRQLFKKVHEKCRKELGNKECKKLCMQEK